METTTDTTFETDAAVAALVKVYNHCVATVEECKRDEPASDIEEILRAIRASCEDVLSLIRETEYAEDFIEAYNEGLAAEGDARMAAIQGDW